MAAAAKETRRNALKPSSDSLSCEARNSKDLSVLKIRRVWCAIEAGLLSFLVDPLVCLSPPLTDSKEWEFVLVEIEYIFCLLAYTWCVLSSLPLDSTDTLRFSLAVSRWWRTGMTHKSVFTPVFVLTHLHCTSLCSVCISWRAYMCLPACVWMLHFGVCDIWRFAPKANKSVMPGIRPWPLLTLHRQAERLINQTASHRCDGFHTNRQQTVKVTSNRVNCQPGRQAGRTFPLPRQFLFPLCCIYLSACLYFLSPPVQYLGVIHMKYLSCSSKNDLGGSWQIYLLIEWPWSNRSWDTRYQSLLHTALCGYSRTLWGSTADQ